MKQREESIMRNRILKENICDEESTEAKEWRKQLKTVKNEKKAKNASLFLYF